jgi:hypothetical protein
MPGRATRVHMIRWALPLCVVLASFDGCTSSQGLSRDSLQNIIQQDESRFVDAPSAAVAPARLNGPTLGLYLKPTGFLRREFEWSGDDRDRVLAWSKQLPLGRGGKSTGFLTLSSLKGHTLTELRTTAARYGVDWVLIFDGAVAVDRYNNYKAPLLYWTLIGAYLADGTHSDALCVLKATLWDVKTGGRVFEERAEAETKSVGPAALVDDKEQVERARTLAMNALLQRLTDRLATLFEGTRQ